MSEIGMDASEDRIADELTRPSLARNSLARFVASIAAILFSMVAGVITARWLGPSGKGTLSTLLTISNVAFFYLCSLGLGDAAIILVGRRKIDLRVAIAASLPLLAISVTVGMVAVAITSVLMLGDDWSSLKIPILVGCITLPVWVLTEFLRSILDSQERIVFTSFVIAATNLAAAVGTFLFVVVIGMGILGGMLGALAGPVVAGTLVAWGLKQRSLSPSLRWDPAYLRSALRLGLPLQGSLLLIAMSQRIDQLLVYKLAGEASAGIYSVALTVGQLVTYASGALAGAAFPRMANVDEREVENLSAQISRTTLAVSVMAAAILFVTSPLAIPLVFGDSYEDAVVPALILVAGGLFFSEQYFLSRALAARGSPGLVVQSFGVSLTTMLVLDLMLIPRFGAVGAGLASVMASAVGLCWCVVQYKRRGVSLVAREYLPHRRDFALLFAYLGQVVPRLFRYLMWRSKT